ncbi:Lrp/AsnC family transcriptional regulator [Acidihalobacter ferrooxydans]|uniref:AsnC family transcriptional regulator n=1 Tax=Acidihalobacter ferrooxydans TaxID=1765967 RepID=A0A1P8UJL3_9GAMM|nr:Lrp/AsnC family transcriptional regulator [Acidihalobacter ferrooxydans]APZ44035.1 AsnC family transcriptional regulator [Acidihalobacter ferrooxydans]
MPRIDKYDRHILEELQRDGRLSNVDLADRIGLSPSPCLRRVKALEATGAILGYGAQLDRETIGLGLTVFVNVKIERHQDASAAAFQAAVLELPEVVSAYLVSGESDYLLQVIVPDLKGYQHFLIDTLLKLPGVADIRSNFAIHTLKPPSPLPLGHLAV